MFLKKRKRSGEVAKAVPSRNMAQQQDFYHLAVGTIPIRPTDIERKRARYLPKWNALSLKVQESMTLNPEDGR